MFLLQPKYKVLLHILYWMVVVVFLSLFFGHFNRDSYNTLFYVCLQLPIVVLTTYAINYWLVPRFLFHKKYYAFFYLLTATIIVSLWMNSLLSIFTFITIWEFDVGRMPGSTFDLFFISAGMYLVVLVGVAIHFVKESFYQQEERHRMIEQQISTDLQLKEARLKMLQNQLHPHTLFNSLNLIYGHSLKKSELTPQLIIHLSNMLDYMLYRCDDERILIEKEIDFLKDYIALEKHKFKDLKLEISWPVGQSNFLIAPLILLPFCENCFKHVKSTTGQEYFIKIDGKIINQNLIFTTFNTCNTKGRNSDIKGIGIKNVKERLAILYEGKHQLTIEATENSYKLQLSLALDPV